MLSQSYPLSGPVSGAGDRRPDGLSRDIHVARGRSRRIVQAAAAGVIAFGWLSLLAGCSRDAGHPVLALHGETMGTTYSIQVVDAPPGLSPEALQQRIDDLLEQVNALMSTYRPDSQLSRFNADRASDWFPVSPELADVVSLAQQISRVSGGAFDVTVGPLVDLWGFGPEVKPDRLPAQEAIDAALATTGYGHLSVRERPAALRKALPGLHVDLSAIAKGYGVDRVAELLESEGLVDYLVEIGGELRGRGRNGHGEPWRIAVERPDAASRSVFRVVALRDVGMATSGDYRNFFELDGRRYSHSIDPSTGWPVTHALASVTVLDPRCARADALATALLVLGPEAGPALARSLAVAALFISREADGYRAEATEAFEAYVATADAPDP